MGGPGPGLKTGPCSRTVICLVQVVSSNKKELNIEGREDLAARERVISIIVVLTLRAIHYRGCRMECFRAGPMVMCCPECQENNDITLSLCI